MKKGFTIIELILVMALFLIIGTLSTAFYSRLYTQSTVTSVTDQLTQSFRKAQSYAMNSKQNGNWGVHNGTSQMTLFQGNTYAGRNAVFDESFSVNGNITVTGFTDLIFSRLTGTPSATVIITIKGNDNTKIMIINNQGIVSR